MLAQPEPAALTLDPATLQDMLLGVFAAQYIDPACRQEEYETRRMAAATLATAYAPQDPIQAGHVTVLVSAHYGALECFRRATLPDMPDGMAMRLHGKGIALARLAADRMRLLDECQARAASGRQPPRKLPASAAPAPQAAPPAGRPAAAAPARPVGRQDPMPSERPPVPPAAAILMTPPSTGPFAAPPRQAGRAALLSSASHPAAPPAGIRMPPAAPASHTAHATA
jgi:hypothetical protein